MNDRNSSPSHAGPDRRAWNKGKLTGPKPPLRPGHVWSIRARLQLQRRTRDLAPFNLAIDSKLRGCDLVALRVDDVAPNGYTIDRATVRQRKTGRPVRFELTEVIDKLRGQSPDATHYVVFDACRDELKLTRSGFRVGEHLRGVLSTHPAFDFVNAKLVEVNRLTDRIRRPLLRPAIRQPRIAGLAITCRPQRAMDATRALSRRKLAPIH